MSSFLSETASDVRRVARGWRWGRRSQVPRSAEPYVLPARQNVFPSDWSRKRPAIMAREVAQKGGLEPLFRSQVRTRVEGLHGQLDAAHAEVALGAVGDKRQQPPAEYRDHDKGHRKSAADGPHRPQASGGTRSGYS